MPKLQQEIADHDAEREMALKRISEKFHSARKRRQEMLKWQTEHPLPRKRPVAFRVPRADPETSGQTISKTEWRLFSDEGDAREAAKALGVDYQGLYVRDGRN